MQAVVYRGPNTLRLETVPVPWIGPGDLLVHVAGAQFGSLPAGWAQVQAISDWVHGNVRFDYGASSPAHSARRCAADHATASRGSMSSTPALHKCP